MSEQLLCCSLSINHLSWTPLPSRACSHEILSRTCLKRSVISSGPYSGPCFFIAGSYAAPSHGHCSQGCPQHSHSQPVLYCLLVRGPAAHLSSLASPPPVLESCHQCSAGASCTVLFLQQRSGWLKSSISNRDCDCEAPSSCL